MILVHSPGADAPGYTLTPLAGLRDGDSLSLSRKGKSESLLLESKNLFFPCP